MDPISHLPTCASSSPWWGELQSWLQQQPASLSLAELPLGLSAIHPYRNLYDRVELVQGFLTKQAELFHVTLTQSSSFEPALQSSEKIPYTLACEQLFLLVCHSSTQQYHLALADPLNVIYASLWCQQHHAWLSELTGQGIPPIVYVSLESLLRWIAQIYRETDTAQQMLQRVHRQVPTGSPAPSAIHPSSFALHTEELAENGCQQDLVVRLINLILIEAVQLKASDIHWEPTRGLVQIRYRMDGVLSAKYQLEERYYEQMASRIKVMAHLDVSERRMPQDGRIQIFLGHKKVDLRVSTLPVLYGERIVIRLLEFCTVEDGLPSLGMPDEIALPLHQMVTSPTGMVLVVGPTGSGKTTTLYSLLSHLDPHKQNILTIEDPIEYQLPGISQMAVNKKIDLDFACGLRHLLRQDPNVIMVGEIRDRETAQVAAQAALTGHLVLSTLHANDAVSTFIRLNDMGLSHHLLASTLTGILAQRLVRKLCPQCRIPSADPGTALLLAPYPNATPFTHHPTGCSACAYFGYQGRTGVYEWLSINEPLQLAIARGAPTPELRALALQQNISPLFSQGLALVAQGITSLTEARRVMPQS